MKNWKTTLTGTLFAAATAIATNPNMVYYVFPSESEKPLAWNIIRASYILVFVFGCGFAAVAKDGGNTPAPLPVPPTPPALPKV